MVNETPLPLRNRRPSEKITAIIISSNTSVLCLAGTSPEPLRGRSGSGRPGFFLFCFIDTANILQYTLFGPGL